MKPSNFVLGAGFACLTAALGASAAADTFTEAVTGGTVSGDFNLRFESVEQDNALDDAEALTLRTRIGYTTGEFNGFSAVAEFEDVRVVGGLDDYSVPPTGFKPGEFSVIADPEVTEVDQGFIQYSSGMFTGKLGRQVIAYDNHRFVGHVGWRQDRQTFEGLTLSLTPSDDLSLSYNYIDERERIFAEDADIESKDHLLNAAYKTSLGTLIGYAYLLEVDNDINNALDTYGVRFTGSTGDILKFLYTAEYATQESEVAQNDADADFINLVLGLGINGITIKAAYELLGSDDGTYGFSTPLATLHKFNGWSDQFLATPSAGLEDISASVSGKLGVGTWSIIYHTFSTDESIETDDLGDELNMQYVGKFGKNYNFGIKAAFYGAGDPENGKVDTDKLWFWIGAKF